MLRDIFGLLKATVTDFFEDECPRLAAALSYYTIFALPPLLILILMIVGAIVDPGDVQKALDGQFTRLIGQDGAAQISEIIANAERPGTGKPLAVALGVAALLFGATGAFVELQAALNRVWEVAPDPRGGGILNFLKKRLISFGMLLAIGFLLIVSLVMTAAVSFAGQYLGSLGGISEPIMLVLASGASLAIMVILFTLMFRVLPDAHIAWRDAWVGALSTTILFEVGRFLIGLYLGRSNPGSAFGAAGSLALVLTWIYYSSLILLLGAEFTQALAQRHGRDIEPKNGAVRIVERKTILDDPQAAA